MIKGDNMRKKIGKKIKQLRIENKISQKELIEVLNISQASLSAYENGNKLPSLEVLIKISNFFKISLDWLCGTDNHFAFYNGEDFLSMFLKIEELAHLDYSINAVQEGPDLLGRYRYVTTLTFTGEYNSGEYNSHTTFYDNNAFGKFMEEYAELNKKLKSLGDNDLSVDYKNLWLEKQLQHYSTIPIKTKKEAGEEFTEQIYASLMPHKLKLGD